MSENHTARNSPESNDRTRVVRSSDMRGRPLVDSVLHLIWCAQEISRAEIARQAALSRSTVSDIVGTLLPTGLVAEVGAGPSSGGRRPIVLRFQNDAAFVLGVEMGAGRVAVAATNLRGAVVSWLEEDFAVRDDPEGTRRLIVDLCRRSMADLGVCKDRIVGIGVAVPSPVNPSDPDWLSEVVLPSWGGRSGLLAALDPLGVPVFIDNDANLGALAEGWWGAGIGVKNFAYIKVATGVGSGHVISGEIYRGATGVAGEIGHLVIDPQGGLCVCGRRGCLATLVGSGALEKRAASLLLEYPDSVLHRTSTTLSAIEEAALEGDALALRLVADASAHLGIAISGMLNLMNPARVILGGALARLGETLLHPLRESIRDRTLVSSLDASEIRTSELGPQSVAVGAATMVLKEALSDSTLFPTSYSVTQ